MFCESCHQREATIHLARTVYVKIFGQEPGTKREQHFCAECADNYFACTPEMNPRRRLICLSDYYRSKLYDLLEATHPDVFDDPYDNETCRRQSDLMQDFLREQLKKDNIEVNADAFMMLFIDFLGSHHYYSRADAYKRKNG